DVLEQVRTRAQRQRRARAIAEVQAGADAELEIARDAAARDVEQEPALGVEPADEPQPGVEPDERAPPDLGASLERQAPRRRPAHGEPPAERSGEPQAAAARFAAGDRDLLAVIATHHRWRRGGHGRRAIGVVALALSDIRRILVALLQLSLLLRLRRVVV